MRILVMCAVVLGLGACDSSGDSAATNATAPRLTAKLGDDAQQARLSACMERVTAYRDLGVWTHGGVRPGMDRSAWDRLSDAERTEIFEVAACLSSAGQVAERMVTVLESGNGPEIETRLIANDRNFAAEAAK